VKKTIFVFSIAILTLFIFINSIEVKATSFAQQPFIQIHCDIDVDFLENNICNKSGCDPIIKNKGEYWTYERYSRWDYYLIYSSHIQILHYNYTFSDEGAEFLKKICTHNITPVIKYVNNNSLTNQENIFYPYKITHKPGRYDINYNIEKIDETWYLKSYSVDYGKILDENRLRTDIQILFCLIILPLILIILVVLIIRQKKLKKQKNK